MLVYSADTTSCLASSSNDTAQSINTDNMIYNVLKKHGFTKHALPLSESESYRANQSNVSYIVSIDNNELSIKSDYRNKKYPNKYKSKNYTFVGTDHGEWGGKLEAFNSKGKSIQLLGKNIINMIHHRKSLYVFTGINHMVFNKGAIYRIDSLNGNPKVTRLTLLPEKPCANFITARNDRTIFYIVTPSGLMSYSFYDKAGAQNTNQLHDTLNISLLNQFWRGLYPTSIVVFNDKIVIGIRSGIVVLKLKYHRKVEDIEYFTKYTE